MSSTFHTRGSPDNIRMIWDTATPQELQEGRDWYTEAHGQAHDLAVQYKLSLHTVAGVLAALSPATRWERSLTDTDRLLYHTTKRREVPKMTTYGKQAKKAIDIAYGACPMSVLGPNAHKTKAFYRLIRNPDDDALVVDTHAYAIWTGGYVSVANTPSLWEKAYRTVEEAYRQVAADIDVKPSVLQATTWVAWHRIWADEMRSGGRVR